VRYQLSTLLLLDDYDSHSQYKKDRRDDGVPGEDIVCYVIEWNALPSARHTVVNAPNETTDGSNGRVKRRRQGRVGYLEDFQESVSRYLTLAKLDLPVSGVLASVMPHRPRGGSVYKAYAWVRSDTRR